MVSAVMDGQNHVATQAGFDLAEKWDKDGSRTIGVITKCDRVESVEKVSHLSERHGFVSHGNRPLSLQITNSQSSNTVGLY
jgi:hypothetical protein